MNESSRLFPASMRAQSNAAIAALRADNDALETAGKALDAFINDDTNRSAAFENLRRKMQDFCQRVSVSKHENNIHPFF